MSDDFEELIALEHDLTEAAGLIGHKAGQAVEQTGMRTKKEWAGLAAGNPLGKQYTATIDYEMREFGGFGQGVYEVEIGPDLARYGGKTGKGGLVPSAGIFDDPLSPVSRPPDRSRRQAEKYAAGELEKGIDIALAQSLAEANFNTSIGAAASAIMKGSIYG